MVFNSATMLAARKSFQGFNKGPPEFWRKRKIFKLTAHMHGRIRNCYSLAIRGAQRALTYQTKDRALKKIQMKDLWNKRLAGACGEHGFTSNLFQESLAMMNIPLNRKVLCDLAIWEPRTFKSMISLAWVKASQEQLPKVNELGPLPENVFPPKS